LTKVNGSIDARVCNTTNIHFQGRRSDACCTTRRKGHLLFSKLSLHLRRPETLSCSSCYGLTEVAAYESVRFSFGFRTRARRHCTQQELCRFLQGAYFFGQLDQWWRDSTMRFGGHETFFYERVGFQRVSVLSFTIRVGSVAHIWLTT